MARRSTPRRSSTTASDRRSRKTSCAPRGSEAELDRPLPSIFAQQAHELALYAHPVRAEDARLIGGIGGLERDGGAALAQPLQRRLLLVDERDDDVAGLRLLLLADDDRVAVENARLDHRIATHLEREMLARVQEVRRQADRVAARLNGGDR